MTTLRKRRDETEWQFRSRLARARQEARDRSEPIVPKEAERHGDYEKGFVTHVETATKAYTVVNRGGTPLCRWIAQKRLSQRQEAAIGYVTTLWRLAGLKTPLTAKYGERLDGGGDTEARANGEVEARRTLHRIQGYVPKPYFDVFEDVCRYGIPAGVAGAALGYASRDAKHTAFLTVCFVADLIAMKEGL